MSEARDSNKSSTPEELGYQNYELHKLTVAVQEIEAPADAYGEPAKSQVLNHLRHASFTFKVREDSLDYPHAMPRDDGLAILKQVSAEKARDLLESSEMDRGAFEFDRTLLLSSSAEAAKTQQETITRTVIDNPVKSYEQLQSKLAEGGLDAQLPGFRYTLEYLVHNLLDDELVRAAVRDSPILSSMYGAALRHSSVVLERAQDEAIPYHSANLAIERCIEVMDIFARGQEPAPELYHSGRYEYYFHSLLSDPNHILFPTPASLSAEDLLKVRAVPIGLVGANTGRMRVDGYVQTPYEFFHHDINHSRRMYQFLTEYAERAGTNLTEFIEVSSQLVEEVLTPAIDKKTSDTEQTQNIKIWTRMLLFEILHEDALPAQREAIIEAALRPALKRTPFEEIDEETGVVSYIMEEGATTLAYLFRKMKHDFYDVPDKRGTTLGDETQRSRYAAVEAATYLLGAIAPEILSKEGIIEELEQLVATDEGFPEAYFKTVEEDIERRIGQEHTMEMLVSIPSDAETAIKAVKKAGKKIVTLYGFSDLEYADPSAMLSAVGAELDRHDPEQTIIVIGATAAGIGAAYTLARARGFHTSGLVSTKALAHGGIFSPDVEDIHFIKDPTWGGYLHDGTLSATTRAFVESADEIHAFGGGLNTVAALHEAQLQGKPVSFVDLAPRTEDAPTPARDYWAHQQD